MPHSGKTRIVVVEDEGLIAADLKSRLEELGYRVGAIAASGAEALRAIGEQSPDLVLMDIRLNGSMDGIQAAERARRDFDVPVVYLTAFEDRQTLERAGLSQAFGYLKKPIASASLRGSIEMAISKHRHERLLREQRDWFQTNFAAVPDAIIATDGFSRISYVNPVAEEVTGCPSDRALGAPLTDVLHLRYLRPDRAFGDAPVEDLVPVAMLRGETMALPADIGLEGPSGFRRLEGTITPRQAAGGINGALIVFRDITTRKFVEEQLSMESRQAALERMAAGVTRSMDLELGVLTDESTRLLEQLPPDSPLRRNAEVLELAAVDASRVLARLHAFADSRGVHLKTVEVHELVKSLAPAWRRLIPELKVRGSGTTPPAEADPRQLAWALGTMLLHARRSMQPGSSVQLETCAASLPELGGRVRIRLAYRGTTENAASLAQAFEPLTAGPVQGLPAAYTRIREMGGFVCAGIERDNVVTLDVYLHLACEQRDLPATQPPGPAILLVEANAAVQNLLRQTFEQNGYRVLEASTCEEALLLAGLYEGSIPLGIANPAAQDPGRADLAHRLTLLKPETTLRMLDGYCDDSGPHRFLTLEDLLAWGARALSPGGEVKAVAAAET